MSSDTQQELEFLLARLDALASAHPGAPPLFVAFVRHYYETASLDALKLRTPEELCAVAWSHFSLAATRAPGAARVRVTPPHAGALARIETCVDDMPFLVDSVSMTVREAGGVIDWTAHPVLPLRRETGGALKTVAADGSAAALESLIHVQFEAPPGLDCAKLEQDLQQVIGDLRSVVADFMPMRERARSLAASLRASVPAGAERSDFDEAAEFLSWLENEHFTFLGYSETEAKTGNDGRVHFINRPTAALGLSRKGGRFADPDQLIAPREELDKYAESARLVVVTKASQRSPVRHPDFMDVISVKKFNRDGSVAGTCRFLGLFSVEAYIERPRNIPLLRRKAEYVMHRSRLAETSHSGKNLRLILHTLPRDELWQSSEDELFQTCMGVRALRDRHSLRLFMRRDRYGRFYSCLVYLPRERYAREIRDRIGAELMQIFGGQSLERTVEFPRGYSARIHYIVRTAPGTQVALSAADIEQRLSAATRSWRDQLRELLLRLPGGETAAVAYADAFPLSYQEQVPPLEAAADLQYLLRLSPAQALLPRLLVSDNAVSGLKLYAYGGPVALSDVLPTLENFGLRVIRQEPAEITPRDATAVWIQEFELRLATQSGLPPQTQKDIFESAFLKAWSGEVENDGLNRLVLAAGLDARQVTCLRLVTKYLIQTGLPFSQAYMEQLLSDHAPIARLLVRLFEARFDPSLAADKRSAQEIVLAQELDALLDKVASLDGDRVLRAYLSVIRAGLRTNYYQGKPYVSLKLDPRKVPELPQPLPLFEIFVYAPEVEGVHLRGGRVARGGLRWSDRRQDFRTEVLGLMKAQQVKNTVIVPVGAKGGFVVKKGDPAQREEWLKTGIECYKTFVRGLLDVTDNRVGDGIQPPPDVVRHDGDDPYLVVAADKGTATFSDIANGLSAEYGFWLGDAFASGGSAGYDHKKMGITAKGAWESVKRHFRELDKDIQTQPFTVVGIGDMSGDVFGNGMLLSRKIRLLAAFDHRHIFLDPDPDCEASYAERERMFALPRSSWADYDASKISAGGGIHPRSAKSIKLSPQVRAALDIRAETLTPAELMKAILRAPVELLWNGGIGTYVKSSLQAHLDVGDRANDAIRINGRELRCKVVGEGGNLGCTQLGRVEAALNGVRLNTDAIDNAGGVHSSDREVNIKIPLNALMAAGTLTRAQRDPLLASLTDEVANFVLRDNYVQSAAVSLLEQNAAARLDEHANLIRTLERDGLLNRAIEFLPDDETLKERRREGRGLTRPELAVLLAYSKISMFDAMLASDVPDDPFLERDLLANFPSALVKTYRAEYAKHQLRREIIATLLTNAVVNRMGISFSHRMAEDHGVGRAEIIRAYAAAHQIHDGDRYWRAIEALDNQVPARLQYKLFERATGLLKHATGWLINTRSSLRAIGDNVSRYERRTRELEALLPAALTPTYREDWDKAVASMQAESVPEALAVTLANTKVLGSAMDIIELAERGSVTLAEAASVYFLTGERLRLPWIHAAIVGLQVNGRWPALARTNLRNDAYRIHRALCERVLQHPGADAAARVQAWEQAHAQRVQFALTRIQELQASGLADFMGLAVAVRELRKLRNM